MQAVWAGEPAEGGAAPRKFSWRPGAQSGGLGRAPWGRKTGAKLGSLFFLPGGGAARVGAQETMEGANTGSSPTEASVVAASRARFQPQNVMAGEGGGSDFLSDGEAYSGSHGRYFSFTHASRLYEPRRAPVHPAWPCISKTKTLKMHESSVAPHASLNTAIGLTC